MRYDRVALKQLRRIDQRYARKIAAALAAYENSGIGDVKKLKGREGYWIRIGDYRAIFEIIEKEVVVLEIGSRGDIY